MPLLSGKPKAFRACTERQKHGHMPYGKRADPRSESRGQQSTECGRKKSGIVRKKSWFEPQERGILFLSYFGKGRADNRRMSYETSVFVNPSGSDRKTD